MKRKTLIFDMDGLIVDSEPLGMEVSKDILKRHGIYPTNIDLLSFYGTSDLEYYERLVEKYSLGESPQKLLKEHNKVYNARLPHASLMRGVRLTIRQLSKQNKLAICSGSYREQILSVLGRNRLLHHFSHITSHEDTVRHKPHKAPYAHTLQALGVATEQCIAFEDSEAGVRSAKAAGIYCVGVIAGNHGTQDLHTAGADEVVHTLEEWASSI